MMDARDAALHASCPVIAAPRFGPLPPMENGQRVIVAANGSFAQFKLDWLDCITALSLEPPAIRLPFGTIQEHMRFSFGMLPIMLIEDFIAEGRARLPNEAAGVLIFSRSIGALRLAMCEPLRTSPVRIAYRRPAMAPDETVAVDLHTHGYAPPCWSEEDDRDDLGIKVAGVFGLLGEPSPAARFRLVLNGFYRSLDRHPWAGDRGVVGSNAVCGLGNASLGRMRGLFNRWSAKCWR